MRKPTESTKIFFDVLSDIQDLRYIFEYGFTWDDNVADLLLSKSSQKTRELAKILESAVYENSAVSPWWQRINISNIRQPKRKLIWQNNYRLSSDSWFHALYRCYGKFDSIEAEDYVFGCENGPYTHCLDEKEGRGGMCAYRRICRVMEEIEVFKELEQTISSDSAVIWKQDRLRKEICREYADVIVSNHGLSLQENTWTDKFMVGGKGNKNAVFETEEEYELFLDMICFFADFAPESALGGFFLNHLNRADKGNAWIFVRNLPFDFGLEQEIVYRILYAMVHHFTVLYDGDEYYPLELTYQDRDMNGLKEHLYLRAMKVNDINKLDKAELLPLYHGAYIESGRLWRHSDRNIDLEQTKEMKKDMVIVSVEFYYNRETEYLVERRMVSGWSYLSCKHKKENVFLKHHIIRELVNGM